MTEKQFDEFAPFWGSDARKYVLVSVQPTSTDLRHCVIVDREGRSAVIIEDDELALEVMRRMVEAGVPILDKLPDEFMQPVFVRKPSLGS